MGNSGFRKLTFPLDQVETPYKTPHDIPLLTTDKIIQYPLKDQQPTTPNNNNSNASSQTVILHVFDTLPTNIPKETPNRKVLLLVDAESPLSFEEISKRFSGVKTYPKVVLNGIYMHPLIKYMKKRCDKFYVTEGMGATRIKDKTGCFVIKGDDYSRVKYYGGAEMDKLDALTV